MKTALTQFHTIKGRGCLSDLNHFSFLALTDDSSQIQRNSTKWQPSVIYYINGQRQLSLIPQKGEGVGGFRSYLTI